MPYDLFIGKSNKVKDHPVLLGSIPFEEHPAISRLAAHTQSDFFAWLANFCVDHTFDLNDLAKAQEELFALLPQSLEPAERDFVYKITAIVSYALSRQQPLHGVAD